jgi:glutathione reductase (NADPH)
VRRAGRSVAMIDHRPFGGTCPLRGCDPKKMLVSGAEAADRSRRMHRRVVVGELRINWKELIAFKRTFTDPVPKKREESFAQQGIDAFHGLARFVGPEVAGHHIESDRSGLPVPPFDYNTSNACSAGSQLPTMASKSHAQTRPSRMDAPIS